MNEIKITYPRGWKVRFDIKPPVCGCCFEEPAVIDGMCQGCYDANMNDIGDDSFWNEPEDEEEEA